MKKISLSWSWFFCCIVTLSSVVDVDAGQKDKSRLPEKLITYLLAGDLKKVKEMTEAGRYVNGRDEEERSAIMLATLGNNLEVIRYLGDQGANLYMKDASGETVLDKAVRIGSLDVIRYFVRERKMDVHGVNERTLENLLYVATGNFRVEVIRYLIEEEDVNVDIINYRKETVLHEAMSNGNLGVMKYLINVQGMDIDAQDEWERGVLHKAASKGYVKVVRYLVNAGANIWLEDYEGMTALKLAEKYGHADVIRFLKREMSFLGRMIRFFKSTFGKVVMLIVVLAIGYLVYKFGWERFT